MEHVSQSCMSCVAVVLEWAATPTTQGNISCVAGALEIEAFREAKTKLQTTVLSSSGIARTMDVRGVVHGSECGQSPASGLWYVA